MSRAWGFGGSRLLLLPQQLGFQKNVLRAQQSGWQSGGGSLPASGPAFPQALPRERKPRLSLVRRHLGQHPSPPMETPSAPPTEPPAPCPPDPGMAHQDCCLFDSIALPGGLKLKLPSCLQGPPLALGQE